MFTGSLKSGMVEQPCIVLWLPIKRNAFGILKIGHPEALIPKTSRVMKLTYLVPNGCWSLQELPCMVLQLKIINAKGNQSNIVY